MANNEGTNTQLNKLKSAAKKTGTTFRITKKNFRRIASLIISSKKTKKLK